MRNGTKGLGKKTTSQPRLPDGVPRVGSERPLFFVIVFNNLVRHRKLTMLRELLTVTDNEAIGLLVRLWCECGERAQNGDLSHYTPAQIAATCGWPLKQAQQLVDAMVEAGFLDRDKRILRVHDWPDYTGRAILNRQANRERVARFRKRHKGQTSNGTVRVTYPLRNGYVRPKTRLDKTREDIEKKRLELEETRAEQTLAPPSPPPSAHPGPSSPSPIFTIPSSSSPKPQPENAPRLEPISRIVHRLAGQDEGQTQNHGQVRNQADNGLLPLAAVYCTSTGLQPEPGTAAYLTKLADKYGEQTVRETLREEGEQIAVADRPLGYLGGILENQRREGHHQVGMVPPEPAPPPRPPEKLVECVACRRKGIETLVSVPIEDPGIGILCQRCAAPLPPPRDPHRGDEWRRSS
jgi:hypothetical protein